LLDASVKSALERIGDTDLVLDVGGWAKPFARADWVLDLMPYETRGLYGSATGDDERFSVDTWVVGDICAAEPWPFDDDQFDFAICSHTLEDVRDPVRVCSELVRVAKAGYVEVPSRLEEQSWGVHGPWVGWSHHRWLVDGTGDGLEFVSKPGVLHGRPELHFPAGVAGVLAETERVVSRFWERSFEFSERIFHEAGELESYLGDLVAERGAELSARARAGDGRSWLRRELGGAYRGIMRVRSR